MQGVLTTLSAGGGVTGPTVLLSSTTENPSVSGRRRLGGLWESEGGAGGGAGRVGEWRGPGKGPGAGLGDGHEEGLKQGLVRLDRRLEQPLHETRVSGLTRRALDGWVSEDTPWPACGQTLPHPDTIKDDGEYTGGIPLPSLHVTLPTHCGSAACAGCVVYLSVYGGPASADPPGVNATYTLRATLRPDRSAGAPHRPVVPYALVDGVPQADAITYVNPEGGQGPERDPMDSWRFYVYYAPAGEDTTHL